MRYIVDGYNVIHKIEELRTKELRGKREALIRMLEAAQFGPDGPSRITVVFDGKHGVTAPKIKSSVQVIFSKHTCADGKIEQLVASSGHARDMTVISDDRRIKSSAGRSGAKKMSVEKFLAMLSKPPAKRSGRRLKSSEIDSINRELEKIWLS